MGRNQIENILFTFKSFKKLNDEQIKMYRDFSRNDEHINRQFSVANQKKFVEIQAKTAHGIFRTNQVRYNWRKMEGDAGYERVRDSDWDEKAVEERKKLKQALANELGMQNQITHFDQINHEDMATSYSGRLLAL